MNELIQLLGLADEAKKADAQKLVDAVKAKINELDAKITEQEKLKNDAIASRDEAKSKLKSIATGLGADVENVEDAIDAIKNKKAGNDDVKDKEITQLKDEIAQITQTLNDVKATSTKEVTKMALKNEIALLLPKYNVKSNGIKYVTNDIENRATFEDGKIVFKNEDGTTYRVDGADATVETIIKEMQQKEKEANESIFFNIDVQQSGASGAGAGNKEAQDFIP